MGWFRTHMFVCLASMLFVRLGQFLIADSAGDVGTRVRPCRPGA